MGHRRALLALFTVATLSGAALLFVVEPMAAKLVLPRLGGAPAVWNGCMLFFQAALLTGYVYAHLLTRLAPRAQVAAHAALFVAALATLPVAIPATLADPGAHAPLAWLIAVLVVSVGLPFFVLAGTGPLLQRWFSATDHPHARDPYFLYAGSNLGSLAGLLAYPFLIEPALRLATPEASLVPLRLTPWSQSTLWTLGYVACGALAVGGGVAMLRRPAAAAVASPLSPAPTASRRLAWIGLSLVPSSLVLGATQYVSSDVAVVPLLWVVPLAAYLLSFVLAFSRRPIGSEKQWGLALAVLALGVALGFWALARPYAWALLVLHPLAVLVAGVVCHRRLAALRPDPSRLTEFYVCVAIGGVAGGLFNAILAPLVFPAVVEYPIALAAACLVRPASPGSNERRARVLDLLLPLALAGVALALEAIVSRSAWTDPGKVLLVVAVVPCVLALPLATRPRRFALALAALMAIAWIQGAARGEVLFRERTFFGVHRVIERPGPTFRTRDSAGRELAFSIPFHLLYHGTTRHGVQAQDANLRALPASYYHRTGPIGQVFAAYGARGGLGSVAVIGAGAGTIAAYGVPGRSIVFYEIDPAVVRIARNRSLFTFVGDSQATVSFVTGDGRLEIAKAADAAYDLIVVDAFSSDAIPVHLITREALALYVRKLRPGGLLAFHLTNQNLDLVPVVDALIADAGLSGLVQLNEIDSPEELMQGKDLSQWAVVARDRATLAPLVAGPRWVSLPLRPGAPPERRYLWTDDYSSVLSVVENW